eukprot:comp22254_c0_seq2/m.52902 comp22254_c0_seq2/g.52902  ORF comp22254_c0_seq2/g.52902 comp22254_c0_seq2/m.52902 type:complete len:327 (+) comp22254_c0_seq2:215-1195(+)
MCLGGRCCSVHLLQCKHERILLVRKNHRRTAAAAPFSRPTARRARSNNRRGFARQRAQRRRQRWTRITAATTCQILLDDVPLVHKRALNRLVLSPLCLHGNLLGLGLGTSRRGSAAAAPKKKPITRARTMMLLVVRAFRVRRVCRKRARKHIGRLSNKSRKRMTSIHIGNTAAIGPHKHPRIETEIVFIGTQPPGHRKQLAVDRGNFPAARFLGRAFLLARTLARRQRLLVCKLGMLHLPGLNCICPRRTAANHHRHRSDHIVVGVVDILLGRRLQQRGILNAPRRKDRRQRCVGIRGSLGRRCHLLCRRRIRLRGRSLRYHNNRR